MNLGVLPTGLMTGLVGRMRGMFYLSHHPVLGVVVLLVLVGLVLWANRSNR